MGNGSLKQAKRAKNDEFYTQLKDIEKELKHYTKHFENKTVYMNCDNPDESNFWKYFKDNFKELKLKKIVSTYFNESGKGFRTSYDGKIATKVTLTGNGDFRNDESIEILKESDIVVTNPPFSLFREYVAQLIEYDKKFIIIGNFNAITYKEFFPLLKDNKVWVGQSPRSMSFLTPSGEIKTVNACWFTNLDIPKRHQELLLFREYSPEKYPTYDNYDAINVDKVNDIPMDYDGVMGVPITFMGKHNPNQFEIVGIACGNSWVNYKSILESLNFNPNIKYGGGLGSGVINGKGKYARVLIKRK